MSPFPIVVSKDRSVYDAVMGRIRHIVCLAFSLLSFVTVLPSELCVGLREGFVGRDSAEFGVHCITSSKGPSWHGRQCVVRLVLCTAHVAVRTWCCEPACMWLVPGAASRRCID